MRKRRLVIATIVVVGTLLLGQVPAFAGSVFPPSGQQAITPQADQWNFGDSNGEGSVTVGYHANPFKIYMKYELSVANLGICQANTLNETVELYDDTTGKLVLHDHHTNAACNYIHHPTYSNGTVHAYHMKVHDVFRVKVGGRTGTATLDAQANFVVTLV